MGSPNRLCQVMTVVRETFRKAAIPFHPSTRETLPCIGQPQQITESIALDLAAYTIRPESAKQVTDEVSNLQYGVDASLNTIGPAERPPRPGFRGFCCTVAVRLAPQDYRIPAFCRKIPAVCPVGVGGLCDMTWSTQRRTIGAYFEMRVSVLDPAWYGAPR